MECRRTGRQTPQDKQTFRKQSDRQTKRDREGDDRGTDTQKQTKRDRQRETDLHLLHDEVGAEDGVPFLWVLSTMLLCPCGLSRRREANHHKHLEKIITRSVVRKQSMYI